MSVWKVGDVFKLRGDFVETRIVQVDENGDIHWEYVEGQGREPGKHLRSFWNQKGMLLVERGGVRRNRAVAL